MLENFARGRDVAKTLQGLDQVWQELPVYVKSKLVDGYGLEPAKVDENLEEFRTPLARMLVRVHLEIGKTVPEAYKSYVEKDVDCGKVLITEDKNLHGDWLLARQEYEAAIATYQDATELGKSRTYYFHTSRTEGIDDIFFTKIGFAYYKMGRYSDATRNWGYAAELQETRGLFLEAVVSKLRQRYWKQAQKVVPGELLNKYYPTVSSILKKAQEGKIELLQQVSQHSPDDDNEEDDDNDTKSPPSPSDDTDGLLEAAFVSHIQGDFVSAHRSFSKVSDTSKEKWGLFSLLLRERQIDGMADIYSKLTTDPFSLLKRAVLQRHVRNDFEWAGPSRRDALDAVQYAQFNYRNSTDTPAALISKVLEETDISSPLRATAYFQVGEYLGSAFSREVNSAEEEEQLDERLMKQLEYIEKALAEPDIAPAVWIHATIARFNTELSIAEHTNHHGDSGATLAARKPGHADASTATLVATSKVVDGVEIKTYVPRKPTRDEAFRQKREETLSKCWERLVELRLDESLAALQLVRQMNEGAMERHLLAVIFGNASTPVQNTREAEYYEDMDSGTGERAEELMRELLAEDAGEKWRKSEFLLNLIRALEKQGKYDQALSVYREFQETEDHKSDMGYHLLQIAELYKKKGDLDVASRKYREVTSMDRSSWNTYGFLGLGEISLERGNLDQALEEFHEGIALAQADLENKDGDKSFEKSNDIAKISNVWYEAGDILRKNGFYKEALDFFHGCQGSIDNPWFIFREGFQKRVSERIVEVQRQLSQDASAY